MDDNTHIVLYGTLIVTLIGFFSPIILFLLRVQKQGINSLEKQLRETQSTFDQIIATLKDHTEVDMFKKEMKSFKRVERKINKKMKLLRPRRQFVRLSISLVLSFVALEFYLLVRNGTFWVDIPYIRSEWIGWASLLFLAYALYVIWQLVTIMIEIDSAVNLSADGTDISRPQPSGKEPQDQPNG